MIRTLIFVATLCLPFASSALADEFRAEFTDPAWNGETIPKGQQCSEYDGAGATPPIRVSGLPEGTNAVLVAFNDESYEPLSTDGGHGIVGFDVDVANATAVLLSVPGDTVELPNGVWIEADNRDDIGVVGYLPPCSGGTGNLYSATLFAVQYRGEDYEVLAETYLQLGRY